MENYYSDYQIAFRNIFDAFEKNLDKVNMPFFPDAEWFSSSRTLRLQLPKQTGHTTFAVNLAKERNAFLFQMWKQPNVNLPFYFEHNDLRASYHAFEQKDIPTLFIIDDGYQFGGRLESLYNRLIKYAEQLGTEYLMSVRFLVLN